MKEKVFDGRQWIYYEYDVYNIDTDEADRYDKLFEAKRRKYQTTQE